VSDYTVEMFHEDFAKVMPLLLDYQEKLNNKDHSEKPEYAVLDMVKYFAEKYGKTRGTDYHMRFLSVMQFIEHYRVQLVKDGVIQPSQEEGIQVPGNVLLLLLDSIKPPQKPSPYPSSPLYNQEHRFNYKKVVRVLKTV
jgi:hypothetical protein